MIDWYLKDFIMKYIRNANYTLREDTPDYIKQSGMAQHRQELRNEYNKIKNSVLEKITNEEIEEVNKKVCFELIKRD